MRTTLGTNCFPTWFDAFQYYSREYYGNQSEACADAISDKIRNKEIIIGSPALKENQAKKLIDNRWHICE